MERYSKSSTSEVKFKLKSICHGAFKVTAIEKWGKNRVLAECKLLLESLHCKQGTPLQAALH